MLAARICRGCVIAAVGQFLCGSSLQQTSSEQPEHQKKKYTIQVCTMEVPVKDAFIGKENRIRIIRMGDLYRYIFSEYDSLSVAQKELLMVKKYFPQAFIREYDQGKLGKAVDLNIK